MCKIAVVGMAGVFPQARNTRQFFDNIIKKKNCIIPVPNNRWVGPVKDFITDTSIPDKAISDKAGIIQNFNFDPDNFSINKDLVQLLDPLHQLVLDAGREAFSQCSHTNETKKNTGVILSAIALPTDTSSVVSQQILLNREFRKTDPETFSSAGVVSLPAAILSRAMGFEAGCFTLDAACASSLYSIKLACEHLHLQKADIMIAGGVSRPDSLYTQIGFTQLQALSPSGRCAPFDQTADGLVVGEGTGIIVLKRLQDAIDQGDTIHAVISGTGVSNDIEGTLVGPASEGQLRAMIQAYEHASWSPDDIQYMECHGSGTPVGDQIELSSIHALLNSFDCPNSQLSIGSVKSMIGHLLTAAGAAGFIKTVLSMNERVLPPSLNYSTPAFKSSLRDSNVTVQSSVEAWEPKTSDTTRKAGISAFGFGGINAHLLIEEFKRHHHQYFVINPDTKKQDIKKSDQENGFKKVPCAIIGMETFTKDCFSLSEFKDILFNNVSLKQSPPKSRWRKSLHGSNKNVLGFFMDQISTQLGEFHIPPNQIRDILPQHILLLKAAKGALEDANINPRPSKEDPQRNHMGCAIGIEFDYGATDFNLRWKINHLDNDLKDKVSKPLTFNRTLGALGGIVASRVAREFKLGGPCFTLSAGAASGIKAIETAVQSLSLLETNVFICGCVDLAGDIRQYTLNTNATSPSKNVIPSEGAAAIVLKRLDQAIQDGDKIYGVISGISGKSGASIPGEAHTDAELNTSLYTRSLNAALKDANRSFKDIDLYTVCSTGNPIDDSTEINTLNVQVNTESDIHKCHVSSSTSEIGATRGVSALFSVIKTALCLHHTLLPSFPKIPASFKTLDQKLFMANPFPTYWNKRDSQTSRKACASSTTLDGACAHVIIEEYRSRNHTPENVSFFQKENQLFVLKAKSSEDLVRKINSLKQNSHTFSNLHSLAYKTFCDNLKIENASHIVSIIAAGNDDLKIFCNQAVKGIQTDQQLKLDNGQGVVYSATRLDVPGNQDSPRIAFVYPGSGNHVPGMGHELATLFPELVNASDDTQWLDMSHDDPKTRILNAIIGQVRFGMQTTAIAKTFNIIPNAAFGHSLGESACLFGLGIFNDPSVMQERIQTSSLFTKDLAGQFYSARKNWNLTETDSCIWGTAAINHPVESIEKIINKYPLLYILIINSPTQTIVGGQKEQLHKFIKENSFSHHFIKDVPSVHCNIVESVADNYYDLHKFNITPKDSIDIYSTHTGERYIPSSDSCAQSILDQALYGFNFPKLIEQAYHDGVRIFLEMGPGSSCTRLISETLEKKPFEAVSLSIPGEKEKTCLTGALAHLCAYHVPVDLSPIFSSFMDKRPQPDPSKAIILKTNPHPISDKTILAIEASSSLTEKQIPAKPKKAAESSSTPSYAPVQQTDHSFDQNLISRGTQATSAAHEKFLNFSQENMKHLEKQFKALTQLAGEVIHNSDTTDSLETNIPDIVGDSTFNENQSQPPEGLIDREPAPFLDRSQCLEYAIGRAGNVLGKEFDIIDSYPVRVRLPDEPLMLVDRIMEIEGDMLSLTKGKIVTQHDVKEHAWYLDGGKTPVSISIEAGQADLFLCAWLGIDHVIKGTRKYRLLDARVTFHRTLPEPGETIEYHIEIDRFLKQGDVYLFFFHYKGYIDDQLLISMRDGCAGFFTEEEVENSGGIILKTDDLKHIPSQSEFSPLVPVKKESFMEEQIEALRHGNLGTAFGKHFDQITLGSQLTLPGGRMHLIDRVLEFDPSGGRFGLGSIIAEADISPDDWFLVCHFIDDKVMPGTLMYDCCAHALRIFTQRMGWVSDQNNIFYDVVPNNESDLKCRGPVTPDTKKARYEIEIKQMGYDPEPFVIADAHMFSDDLRIVLYKNMGIKIVGLTQNDLNSFWREQ